MSNTYPNPYAGAYARQAKEYKQKQIETATQEELLILLYEGAIKFLLQAKQAYEKPDKPDMQTYHNKLMKAQAIIHEFMVSLDMEIGGEVAKNLYNLYEYLHYRLVQANIKKDVTMIDEVLGHLRGLKATWEEAIKIAAREKSANGGVTGQFINDEEFQSQHNRSA